MATEPSQLYPALQALSWLVASVGGVFVAYKGVREMRETRLWRKTELAKKILDEIWADERCTNAMVLLDWSNREFAIDSDDRVRISRTEVQTALSRTEPNELKFSKKAVFIRDCFDSMLDALQRIEHYIEIDLIDFNDVKYPLEYTVDELTGLRREIEKYIDAYEFHFAKRFLDRYPQWRNHEDKGRPPCVQE
jgi:hypothetical protein